MNLYVSNFKKQGYTDHFDYQNDTANFSTQEGLVSGATKHSAKKYN
jgi:hypothetical protein